VWVPELSVLGWPERPEFWLVLRHADVESVLTWPGLFSSALGATQIRDPGSPEALAYVRKMMLNMDPPGHSRLRRLLSRSLTLADVLGVPEQDRRLLFDWSNRVIGYQDPDYAASAEFDPSAGTSMAAEALKLRPAPDPETGRMPDPFWLFAVAGNETLRWWTPVMTFRRTATEDCSIGGQAIRAGDKVVVSFTSANRDEAVFAAPDRFDIRRQPNPHLVFGHGPHFCLDAHLARAQMRALFVEVLARTSSLCYAGEPSYLRSNFQRGVKRLPVTWTAAR
jgi:cytochrome P450